MKAINNVISDTACLENRPLVIEKLPAPLSQHLELTLKKATTLPMCNALCSESKTAMQSLLTCLAKYTESELLHHRLLPRFARASLQSQLLTSRIGEGLRPPRLPRRRAPILSPRAACSSSDRR